MLFVLIAYLLLLKEILNPFLKPGSVLKNVIGVNLDLFFHEQPNRHPKTNIKYRLIDEEYLINPQEIFPIPQGGGRFGLFKI